MAKAKTQYVCSECGSTQMKWMGKCPDCGEWNTLQEFVVREQEKSKGSLLPSGATASSRSMQTASAPAPPALS